MWTPLLGLINDTWYLIPLAVVISLVYSASRFELTEAILHRSVRLFLTIMAFMLVVMVVLWALTHRL